MKANRLFDINLQLQEKQFFLLYQNLQKKFLFQSLFYSLSFSTCDHFWKFQLVKISLTCTDAEQTSIVENLLYFSEGYVEM